MKTRKVRSMVALAALTVTLSLAPMLSAYGGGGDHSKPVELELRPIAQSNPNYVWIALLGIGLTMLIGYVAAKTFRGEEPAADQVGHGPASHEDEHP